MSSLKLLFAASEVYPFAKSGGLADVAHSLPRALSQGAEVDVVMPLYQFVTREKFGIVPLDETFEVSMGSERYPVELYGCRFEGVNYIFVYSPLLSDREYLYGSPENGYEDNAIRFGIFNHAIVALLKRGHYAIAHLNDWQCGLVPLLVADEPSIRVKTLYTIHNLAYQGTFEKEAMYRLGIGEQHFTIDGIEFYGQISFMKAGIGYADHVTTVSPTYAKEILTRQFGCGLEGYLRSLRHKLTGIVNGIDTEHFSPSDDTALVQPYSDLAGKALNKKVFLQERGLKGVRKPLFVFIGRFTWQKGMDLLIESLPKIAATECNIAILGEGEQQYHDPLKEIAREHHNIHLEFGYDEGLSHRMYAAADFLLMPSLFEPCGLNQMIAMHYGAMPIVHSVGGLVDTVHPAKQFKPMNSGGFGILFSKPTQRSLVTAVGNAQALYADRRRCNRIAQHNMGCDFSWEESARHYEALYHMMLEAGDA